MARGKKQIKIRKRAMSQYRQESASHHEVAQVERLARGEFNEADFHALLLLLSTCEWVQDNYAQHADLAVRTNTVVLRESLLNLLARRHCKGTWTAGTELQQLRDAVYWLSDWTNTLPEKVVSRAEFEMQKRYIQKEQPSDMAA